MAKIQCKDIPVCVIALSDEKFATAKKRIREATQFTDVQRWNAVRGSDLFDESLTLLPNYQEIVRKKYPHLHIPRNGALFLSKQTELSLSVGRTNSHDLHNAASVGCALSHISIWQHVVENNIAAMMIFEDDVQFKKSLHFCNELDKILKKFSLDFDVLNFHLRKIPSGLTDATKTRQTALNSVIVVKGIAMCTQGYLITLEGAKLMLAGAFPLSHTVDRYMTMLSILPTTKDRLIYLATKKPWLTHPPDLKGSQIKYSLSHLVSDALFLTPHKVLLAIIGICVVSIICVIILVIMNIKLARRLKRSQREAREAKNKIL